jgi:hypothetical protein
MLGWEKGLCKCPVDDGTWEVQRRKRKTGMHNCSQPTSWPIAHPHCCAKDVSSGGHGGKHVVSDDNYMAAAMIVLLSAKWFQWINSPVHAESPSLLLWNSLDILWAKERSHLNWDIWTVPKSWESMGKQTKYITQPRQKFHLALSLLCTVAPSPFTGDVFQDP